jgi:hypothetical protein
MGRGSATSRVIGEKEVGEDWCRIVEEPGLALFMSWAMV